MDNENNIELGLDYEKENEKENKDEELLRNNNEAIVQTGIHTQNQLQWTNNQVNSIERELLLNNNALCSNFMSNWSKVMITSLAVFIPGIGQIVGVIMGLVYVSSDSNSDKRSFGAALITVSLITFVLTALFWFIVFILSAQTLYY